VRHFYPALTLIALAVSELAAAQSAPPPEAVSSSPAEPGTGKEGSPADAPPVIALAKSDAIASDGKSAIKIALMAALPAEAGTISFILRASQSADVVELAEIATASDAEYEIDLSAIPLAPDNYRIDVGVIEKAGKRYSLGMVPLIVSGDGATPLPGAFTFTPKVDLGIKTQLRERVSGGAKPSARPTYQDTTIQASFETSQAGVDWDLKTRMAFAGSSVRAEAVTFGTHAAAASKFDLQDYLVDLGYRDSRAQLGQVSSTAHPILYSSVSNRGFNFAHRLPLGVELNASAQAAGSLTGSSNFTGLSNRDSLFRSYGFGYDILQDKPGQYRVDAMRFEGRQPVQLPDGRIDSERSEGNGFRFAARNDASNLRGEAIFAVSDHYAPRAEGGIAQNHGHAYTFESGYDFLKDFAILGKPLALGASARREFASPMFRSLGSSFLSNYQLNVEVLTAQWGGLQAQLQGLQRLDNVDADKRYVRNRVSAQLFNVNVPADWMAALWREFFPPPKLEPKKDKDGKVIPTPAPSAPKWIPIFSLSRNVYNQFADEGFIPEGYGKSDLPHVVSTNHALGLDWKFTDVSVSWKSTLVGEKNLQLGEELQSSSKRRHGGSVEWKVTKAISVGFSSERAVGERLDSPVDQINRQNRAKFSWKIDPKNELSADYSHGKDFDTFGNRSNTAKRLQAQYVRRMTLPIGVGGKELPAQAYLRFIDNDAINATRVGNLIQLATPRTMALQCGITISLF
jgi:hypothetical protein